MTEISALEALLRDRAFSARIKQQYGSPGAAQPNRNDLQVGKQDMIDTLTSRSRAQTAALASSLVTAAALLKEAKAPPTLQLRSPTGSEGSRRRAASPQSRAGGCSPGRSGLSKSSRSAQSPGAQGGPAAAGVARSQARAGGETVQQGGHVGIEQRQQQGGLGGSQVQQQQQQQRQLPPDAPGHAIAATAPAAPSPARAPAPRTQPAATASPEYWARMGRSKDQMDSSSCSYQVQARAYHTYREWDPRVGAVQTVARPDTWRTSDPHLQQQQDAAQAAGPGGALGGGGRRPMSAPVTGSTWNSSRPQEQQETDAMYGITEEDPGGDVDPALATPLRSPSQQLPPGHAASHRARTAQQQQLRPGRPSSAPVHSFHLPARLQLPGSSSRPGSASLRPPSAGVEQPPARSSCRSISHQQPPPPPAAVPPPRRSSSSCRRSSPAPRGPDSPAGSSGSHTSASPLGSPTLLRPTRSFLSKCVPEALPAHAAAWAEPRPGPRGSGGGVSGDVEVEPMVRFEDGGGRGAPAALSPPVSPRRVSSKVPPTMLQTMLNVYENLYQYS